MSGPNFKKQYEAMGSEPDIKTPEQFAAMIKSDFAKWGEVIRKGRITVD